MSAARKLSEQPESLRLFNPDAALEWRFERWLAKTGCPIAASILATADERRAEKREFRIVMTPPQVAEQLGVDPATVIAWIRSDQLKASNIGKGGKRPRYRIKQSDLDAFLKSRQPEPRVKRKRRVKEPAVDIEFFN